jgi:hypothetical protein
MTHIDIPSRLALRPNRCRAASREFHHGLLDAALDIRSKIKEPCDTF